MRDTDIQGMKLVVALPDPLIREGITIMLQQWDCHICDNVRSGDDLRQSTALHCPDMILVNEDLLSCKDGLKAASDIEKNYCIPAAVFTLDSYECLAFQGRVSCILQMPIDAVDLRHVLSQRARQLRNVQMRTALHS